MTTVPTGPRNHHDANDEIEHEYPPDIGTRRQNHDRPSPDDGSGDARLRRCRSSGTRWGK
ncbi:hypothetical protein [Halorussus sp. MSC15.2]|uniref:hypothetical protein n=1 Tax=Halorussus sp. MSC15.2 TaxID=2283638 RepID=UPI0013D6C598|nr:hypothetical protein [Halorussus sp. MSC15.2]NEU57853.1 hypothetical protein [Halorussus sp. MSC15.2]